MRAHGCIRSGSRLGADGHACWAFDQREEFLDAAIDFLADGLHLRQRIAYVGSEPVAVQREQLGSLGDVDAMVGAGTLQLFELGDLYRVGEPIDIETQLAIYDSATDAALADGYTGLRVAAQVTDLVTAPDTWDAHVRWESTADRVFSGRPLSALCGYRRDAVPERVLADLAAVHPAANEPTESVPFHLFGESGNLVVSGEVDLFSTEAFDRALGFACSTKEPLTLDLGELEFIDHHGLETLATHTHHLAATGGCTIRNTPPGVNRLCALLEVSL